MFAPVRIRHTPLWPGRDIRLRHSGILRGDDRASQVPGEPHCMHALLLTPVGPRRECRHAPRCCLPHLEQRRLPQGVTFGAQSHGLHTPCVRFMSGVTPLPCNTRFRLSAHLPDGIGYPPGSNEKFPRFIQSLSNFPGFAWRTQGLTPRLTRTNGRPLPETVRTCSGTQVEYIIFRRGIGLVPNSPSSSESGGIKSF